MKKRMMFMIFVLALAACDDDSKPRAEIRIGTGEFDEGSIIEVEIYGKNKQYFADDAMLVSSHPAVASIKTTPLPDEDDKEGFFLFAHRAGPATLTAQIGNGPESVPVEVVITEQ
jgi:hypothetical protein